MKRLMVSVALVLMVVACGGEAATDDDQGALSNPAFGEVTVSGSLPAFESVQSDAAVGQDAPSLSGVDPTGAAVEFTPGSSPAVLLFVAHWCPHCQAEVPLVVSWLESNPDALGIDILAVATGTAEGQPNFPPADWLEREGWTAPIIMDDENSTAGVAFGLTSYPFWVIVASDGTVAGRVAGGLGEDGIDPLLNEVSGL